MWNRKNGEKRDAPVVVCPEVLRTTRSPMTYAAARYILSHNGLGVAVWVERFPDGRELGSTAYTAGVAV